MMIAKKIWYLFLLLGLSIIFYLRVYVFNDLNTITNKKHSDNYSKQFINILKGFEFDDNISTTNENNIISDIVIDHNNRYKAEYLDKVYDNNKNITTTTNNNNSSNNQRNNKDIENKNIVLKNNENKFNQELIKSHHESKTKKSLDKLKIGNSDSSRLLLIIGLDYSGYKSVLDMFRFCTAALPLTCIGNDLLTKTISIQSAEATKAKELFTVQDKNNINSNQNIIENRMKEIANDNQGKVYYYSVNHLDFFSVAKIAESHNLDFRILFIQRSAKDILSDASKVKSSNALSIINNADEIHNQLKKLNHEFYYCINFDTMFSMSLIDKYKLRDFIHPTITNKLINDMFEDFEVKAHENNLRQRKLYGNIDEKESFVPKEGKDNNEVKEEELTEVHEKKEVLSKIDINRIYNEKDLEKKILLINDLCNKK